MSGRPRVWYRSTSLALVLARLSRCRPLRATGVSHLVPRAPLIISLLRSEDGFAVGKGGAHSLADRVRFFARDREDDREAAVRLVCVIGARPKSGNTVADPDQMRAAALSQVAARAK
jgi:hypothetical protein